MRRIGWNVVALLLVVLTELSFAQDESDPKPRHSFRKLQLSQKFFSKGASFGDFNRDGHNDVVSGPFWYAGPEFVELFANYQTCEFPIDGYSDNFLAWSDDLNSDGWPDILVVGEPGLDASWHENPRGRPGHWLRHRVFDGVDNESPHYGT